MPLGVRGLCLKIRLRVNWKVTLELSRAAGCAKRKEVYCWYQVGRLTLMSHFQGVTWELGLRDTPVATAESRR